MNDFDQVRFDQRETEEILKLAGLSRRRMDTFTREDLIRAASEIDIAPELVEKAEQLVRERQSELDDRAEYRRAKVRQTWKEIGICVPILVLVLSLHTFSFVAHVFSSFKGMIKGLSGLIFAKATGHELEFQTWRNDRFYKAMYGSKEIAHILEYYFRTKTVEDYEVLIQWLIETNGVAPDEATRAVGSYARDYPERVLHSPFVGGFLKQKNVFQRDVLEFFGVPKKNSSDEEEPRNLEH